MKTVLLIGAGEVGGKHLHALAGMPDVEVTAVVDPAAAVPGVPRFACRRPALRTLRPDLVIVAAPPGTALDAAREAVRYGTSVLVEKPATTDPARLAAQDGDERIFVGFQPHFAPGLAALLAAPPPVATAHVLLDVLRDPDYFRGWRRDPAIAGRILHQQAIHGLALALRLLPDGPDGNLTTVEARVIHRRGFADCEDQVAAELTFAGGVRLTIDAHIDSDGPPRHEVHLDLADRTSLQIRGRNLEAGLGVEPAACPTHEQLRRQMYTAVLSAGDGATLHPSLFPLGDLARPLEVIDRVYHSARIIGGHAPAA